MCRPLIVCALLAVEGCAPVVTYLGPRDSHEVRLAADVSVALWSGCPQESLLIEERSSMRDEGATLNSSHIVLREEVGVRLSSTALSHEIAHVCLWRATGSPDWNHAEPLGDWTEKTDAWITETNDVLRCLGL